MIRRKGLVSHVNPSDDPRNVRGETESLNSIRVQEVSVSEANDSKRRIALICQTRHFDGLPEPGLLKALR